MKRSRKSRQEIKNKKTIVKKTVAQMQKIALPDANKRPSTSNNCSMQENSVRRSTVTMPQRVLIKGEKDFAVYIRQRRKMLKIGQVDLAKYSRVSQHGISNIETGKETFRMSTLFRLQQFLGFRIILELED
ncbi:MAG: helix-turn-helix domain-containing protein [Bacteriovoracaceae bacterium]|nr:helix-turn-helix domain-containing protein [Bacteriovoracaceae bacterium]